MSAVLLLGCAVMTAACGLRAAASLLVQERQPTTPAEVLGAESSAADAVTRSRVETLLGKLPLHFIENRGQEDPRVAYYVQGRDTTVYFTRTGVTFALTGPKAEGAAIDDPSRRLPLRRVSFEPGRVSRERWAVQLDFVGASAVTPRGEEPTPAVVSYFKAGEGQSHTGLRTNGSIVYSELWPGIDLVYTGTAGRLKYTFLVKPGADPDQIRLAYRGATAVRLTDTGELAVSTPVGGFTDERPYAYQEESDRRAEVTAAYAMIASAGDGAQGYGFKVGRYDRTRPLVLDPSVLIYAGYIGGSGDEGANGIAVDAAGNAYVVGLTNSAVPSFPGKVGPDLILNGGFDAFVAKIKADGSDFVYLGYIGGAGFDEGTAIAVDKAGNAYVTGRTDSDQTTFPVKVGPSLVFGGGTDAFVAKVKPDGTALVYCGYIGGAAFDGGSGIAVDGAGNVYITGETDSDQTTFPVKVGPDLNFNGEGDAFVAKVRADGTGLVYAGYIGGADFDTGRGIAVDAAGNAYIAGTTRSDQTSFPVKVGPDLTFNLGNVDAFVAKVKADGTALVYLGYIGGADFDSGRAIAVDAAGNAYVTGFTRSDQTTFPVKVGPDLIFGGEDDAFVAKVKADGTTLLYAGYIGGADFDGGSAIAVDPAGNAYVAGFTDSDQTSFPVKLGPTLVINGEFDAFVAKVKADGTGLLYAGYIGGQRFDEANAIALDAAGNVYVAGDTRSDQDTFPVTVGPDRIFSGGDDAFIAKISGKPELAAGFVNHGAGPRRPGDPLGVVDFVQNLGLGAAKASTTRYYLSTDTVKSSNDILLIGSHGVPSLEAGAFTSGFATVTIPISTPPGFYHVLACADDTKALAENDENNNCFAPAFVLQVAVPDLVVEGVSDPPQTAKIGSKFTIFDNSVNRGAVSAAASTTRFYLSKDTAKGAGDLLIGTRAVPALTPLGQAGNLSSGSALGTIPNTVPGAYRVLACADDTNIVKETSETNNCRASSTTVQVTK